MQRLTLAPLPGRGHAPWMHKGASEAMRTEPCAPSRSATGGESTGQAPSFR
jgi:hypothetical protein